MYTTLPAPLVSKSLSLIYSLIIGYWLDIIGFCVIFYLEQRGFIVEIKFTTGGVGEIRRIIIPDDMVIRSSLDLSKMGLKELPDLSAVTVTGDFICRANQLTSLQGAPQSVGGYFDCRHNRRLTSVVGAPQKIGGDFIYHDERLKQEYQKMILERKSQNKKCFIKFKNAIAKLLAKKQQL